MLESGSTMRVLLTTAELLEQLAIVRARVVACMEDSAEHKRPLSVSLQTVFRLYNWPVCIRGMRGRNDTSSYGHESMSQELGVTGLHMWPFIRCRQAWEKGGKSAIMDLDLSAPLRIPENHFLHLHSFELDLCYDKVCNRHQLYQPKPDQWLMLIDTARQALKNEKMRQFHIYNEMPELERPTRVDEKTRTLTTQQMETWLQTPVVAGLLAHWHCHSQCSMHGLNFASQLSALAHTLNVNQALGLGQEAEKPHRRRRHGEASTGPLAWQRGWPTKRQGHAVTSGKVPCQPAVEKVETTCLGPTGAADSIKESGNHKRDKTVGSTGAGAGIRGIKAYAKLAPLVRPADQKLPWWLAAQRQRRQA